MEDSFYGENNFHKQHVCFKQGAKYLKKIKPFFKNEDLIIHIYDQPEVGYGDWIQLLFINRDLFLTTVRENLLLFQYVLGAEITPEKLLEKFIDPKENFHKILNRDQVLIGIVLGYGAQNSLRGARAEHLQNKLVAAEEPPFINPVFNEDGFSKRILLQVGTIKAKSFPLEAGFGYENFKDELNEIHNQMQISSEKLESERPYFIYGRYKDDEGTSAFIGELEKTQTKIQELLKSQDFFKKMLQSFFQEGSVLVNKDNENEDLKHIQDVDAETLEELVAANIWQSLDGENESYIEGFFEGMKGDVYDFDGKFSNYHIINQLGIADTNIKLADQYFAELEKDENVKCVNPNKIYVRCIEEGDYKIEEKTDNLILEDHVKVSVHWTIKTPENRVLSDTWSSGLPVSIDLSKTIDGFRFGMKGMKVGEIREIYIHPTVGYGIYTTLEKGVYLKARVQLVSIDSMNQVSFNIEPLDFTDLLGLLKNTDFASISKHEGFVLGQKIWSHYKKGMKARAEQIIGKILNLKSGKEIGVDLRDSSNQELINRLHWSIYNQ